MKGLSRITRDPTVMGGKPCIRGMRVTVGTIVGLMASGQTSREILEAYPYLEEEDIREALAYPEWPPSTASTRRGREDRAAPRMHRGSVGQTCNGQARTP